MSNTISFDDVLAQKLKDDPEFREAYKENERATDSVLWFSEKLREADEEIKRLRAIAAQWAEYTEWRKPEEMPEKCDNVDLHIVLSEDVDVEYGEIIKAGSVVPGTFRCARQEEPACWLCYTTNDYEEVEWLKCAPPRYWLPMLEPEPPKESKA